MLLLPAILLLASCTRDKAPRVEPAARVRPNLRIIALGGAAGAVEPCGCVANMLGGVDHVAALVQKRRSEADAQLVFGAGPMFFADPVVPEKQRAQALMKADAMAASLRDVGLVAFAPGANDFGLGPSEVRRLVELSGAKALAQNLPPEAGVASRTELVEAGRHKVGVVGITAPRHPTVALPFAIGDAEEALKRGRDELVAKGAQIFVALVAASRGDAVRLAERVSGYQLFVVGRGFDQGDTNEPPQPATTIGETLLVSGQNHLQGVAVVDLFIVGSDYTFADGVGLDVAEKRANLLRKKGSLEGRLSSLSPAEASEAPHIRGEITRIDADLARLAAPRPKAEGSYFEYELAEVTESAGAHPEVAERLVAYYRRVNEHNQRLFAGDLPEPAPPGTSGYVGVEKCTSCHQEERTFWDGTRHAGAYETLTSGHKEFNLDCVSCHVTGYAKPGGSTVVHVKNLTDVQCEVCHGPGSRHVDSPVDPSLIVASPPRSLCTDCHHPPHVNESWSVDASWPHILGKGHGYGK